MKLKSLRAVHIDLPPAKPKTPSRRAPWPESAPRAMPINFYPQFSRKPQDMPGNVGLSEVWVQAIAEDGTFGLGKVLFRTAGRGPISIMSSRPCSKVRTAWQSSL